MPVLTFTRSAAYGAIIDAALTPSAAERAAIPTLNATVGELQLKMLVDTGADNTTLDEQRIAPWGLTAKSFFFTRTIAGQRPVWLFELSLLLRDGNGQSLPIFEPLLVRTRERAVFDGLPYSGLIGRDVLDRCVLHYDGPASAWTLSIWPQVPDAPVGMSCRTGARACAAMACATPTLSRHLSAPASAPGHHDSANAVVGSRDREPIRRIRQAGPAQACTAQHEPTAGAAFTSGCGS